MSTRPKVWTMEDVPTPPELAEYLARIQAVRDAFPDISGFPALPPDMDRFTYAAANDLEQVLLQASETVIHLKESRVYSGELQAGGV